MYIPDVSDLQQEDYVDLAVGRADQVANRLHTTRERIRALISRDDVARETVLAAQAEFRALLDMRVALLSVDALDTLENVMRGPGIDAKSATAQVRAAESILDRGLLPKRTRHDKADKLPEKREALPDLNGLLEQAETDDRAHQIVDQYMKIMRDIEAMRRGAKEIIDANVDA